MVKVSVEGASLICEVLGSHRFWAMRSRIEIPLSHITGVRARPDTAKAWWHGWKMVGTDVPGHFAAGLFRTGGKWAFWDVRHPENTIEIDIAEQGFEQLILEVENPEETASLISDAVSQFA